jgi:hypothetical protein
MNAKAAILGHAPEVATHIVEQLRARREQQKQMLAALQFQEAEKAGTLARQKALFLLQSGHAAEAKAAEIEARVADNIRANLQKDENNRRSNEERRFKTAADQVKSLASEASKLGAKTDDLPMDKLLLQDQLDPNVAGPIAAELLKRITAASRMNAEADRAQKMAGKTAKPEITPAQWDLMKTRARTAYIKTLQKKVTTSVEFPTDPETGQVVPRTVLDEPALTSQEEAGFAPFFKAHASKAQLEYAATQDPWLLQDTGTPVVSDPNDPLNVLRKRKPTGQ